MSECSYQRFSILAGDNKSVAGGLHDRGKPDASILEVGNNGRVYVSGKLSGRIRPFVMCGGILQRPENPETQQKVDAIAKATKRTMFMVGTPGLDQTIPDINTISNIMHGDFSGVCEEMWNRLLESFEQCGTKQEDLQALRIGVYGIGAAMALHMIHNAPKEVSFSGFDLWNFPEVAFTEHNDLMSGGNHLGGAAMRLLQLLSYRRYGVPIAFATGLAKGPAPRDIIVNALENGRLHIDAVATIIGGGDHYVSPESMRERLAEEIGRNILTRRVLVSQPIEYGEITEESVVRSVFCQVENLPEPDIYFGD